MMKKKQMSTKIVKSKSIQTSNKKVSMTKKSTKQDEPQMIMFLGDNFYVAETKTQRKKYINFEQTVKVAKAPLKKSRVKSIKSPVQTINIQQYVKLLSKQQKEKLFKDLEKQMKQEQIQQKQQISSSNLQDKQTIFLQKLQSIRIQLLNRWNAQISEINSNFENQNISLEEKNQKILLFQKIRDNKINMLNYTQTLFQKILREEDDFEQDKAERMENVINSLDNMAEVQVYPSPLNINLNLSHGSNNIREPQDRNYVAIKDYQGKRLEEDQLKDFYSQNDFRENRFVQIQNTQKDQNIQAIRLQKESLLNNKMMKIEHPSEQIMNLQFKQNVAQIHEVNPNSSPFNKNSLKLDFRLDEIQLGKDHYEDQQKPENDPKTLDNQQKGNKIPEIPNDPNIYFKKVGQEQFISTMNSNNPLAIPMLMTKDKLQQIQMQKKARQIQMMNVYMKNKQSFQLSQIVMQGQHFTTLVDVNQFIVQFYEFLMKVQMQEVIDGLNIPYGKSCVDKLRILIKHGFIPPEDNIILRKDYLDNYHSQYQLQVRRLNQYERIHNRAIFDAFNYGLNVYRPFFELEGQVYPWTTSQKGLTFYQISQDNIEQVFEKSKMKVLEYCASLCGLIPGCDTTTQQPKKILEKRNSDCYQRIVKSETVQKYSQWNISKVNFQALFRIVLSEEIFQSQILLLFTEISKINKMQ